MSVYRIPFLFTAAACVHKSFTAPQPPPEEGEGVAPRTILERISMSVMSRRGPDVLTLMKIGAWTPALAETIVILADRHVFPELWKTDILYLFTGSTSVSLLATSFPPLLLFGTAVALAGATLRISAFHTLGRHFTFELALRKDHRLMTCFPYSVVRHPGYLGGWIAIAGLCLTLAPHDGWVRAALVPRLAVDSGNTATQVAAAFVAGAFTLMGAMSLSRVNVEDAMLRERFGHEWDAWARRVPYKMVPYVW